MSAYYFVIDELLAPALRVQLVTNPQACAAIANVAAVVERIDYHGIAGLLHDDPGAMAGWPGAVITHVRDAAVAQAMWQAIPGPRRKFGHLRARALPSAAFGRAKYTRDAGLPLPLLYARRLFDLSRARTSQGPKR